MPPAHRPLGVALSFLCLILLGIMPVISNSRPEGSSALAFAFFLSLWQLLIALPVMLIEIRFLTKGIFSRAICRGLRQRSLIILLLTGAIFGLSTYVYILAVAEAGAVSAAIAIQAYPVFATLWEAIFLKRKKSPTELGFTFLLIGTLYYLGTGGEWTIHNLSPWFLLALAVPFLWSVAHVVIKETLGATPVTPAQITFIRVFVSSLLLGGTLVAIEDTASIGTAVLSSEFQESALWMGFVYYLELIIWFYAIRHIDVSVASSVTAPWPALTMLLAILFLGDPVHSYQIMALMMVALSLYGLLVAGARRQRNAARKPF